MPLLTLQDVSLEFGDIPILRHADLVIEPNERVCLIGRNGAGKSTLFKLITGEQQPDSGEIRCQQGLRISQLAQALPSELGQTVYNFVAGGLGESGRLAARYALKSRQHLDAAGMRDLEDLQHSIEAEGGWNPEQSVETILTALELPARTSLRELSGGWQRRVGLARALVRDPDLLLLDEPTNHLDLAALQWLEDRVRAFTGSVLFITHDRAFLKRLATRIIELDRTKLTSWPGDYDNFLRRKEDALHAEALEKAAFGKKLTEEEFWIRQGIKARRTRNEGRVRALEAMRREYAERQKLRRQGAARIYIEESANESGRKVIELNRVTYGYGGEPLIDGLSLKIMRGDRIGLIGNNGVGKSTLLKLMLGELAPQGGTVKLGTNLEIAYFDQMRQDLDPDKTIAEVVGGGCEYLTLNGKERHVIGYLRGFLFSAQRAMSPIKALSGGEHNRVILARLFTRASNLLVLDEPANDLDVETLEVLEDRLIEYQGTLIVVSHDREFLDNVITSTLVFEADGKVRGHVGGYSDWLRRGRRLAEKDRTKKKSSAKAHDLSAGVDQQKPAPKKLSYKLKLELEQLPDRIEALEAEVNKLQDKIADPDFYGQPFEQVQPILDELANKQRSIDEALARWQELESQQG
jgi:ATP-binding cassette subfamily F protein uup